MAGQEIVQRTPAEELVVGIRSETFQEQVALALPEGIPTRRFVRAAITAVLQNPDIAVCERNSIIQSLLQCAQTGLMPDGKQAALVKYGSRAQFLPMISGYRLIAADHGWTLETRIVRSNDEFSYDLGDSASIVHRPVMPGKDKGEMVAAYAVAKHHDGRRVIEVMDADEIAKVKSTSRAAERGPWKDWPDRMWEKTVGKRLFKKLGIEERDQQRVSALLAADDPAGSAELMYGPNGAESIPPRAGDGRDATSVQQAGAGETPHEDPEPLPISPAPAPDFDDVPWPEEPTPTMPAASAADPGMFEVQIGRKYRGWKLAAIADVDEKWLTDILKKPRPAEDPVYAEHWDACAAYVAKQAGGRS